MVFSIQFLKEVTSWGGGNPTTLQTLIHIISRLDKQGAIEENVFLLNRHFHLI